MRMLPALTLEYVSFIHLLFKRTEMFEDLSESTVINRRVEADYAYWSYIASLSQEATKRGQGV